MCAYCRLQIGYFKRLQCTETFALSWKFMLEEEEYMRKRKVEFEMNALKDDLTKDKKLWVLFFG